MITRDQTQGKRNILIKMHKIYYYMTQMGTRHLMNNNGTVLTVQYIDVELIMNFFHIHMQTHVHT